MSEDTRNKNGRVDWVKWSKLSWVESSDIDNKIHDISVVTGSDEALRSLEQGTNVFWIYLFF